MTTANITRWRTTPSASALAPTAADCLAAARSAIDCLAAPSCDEVRAGERSAIGCCYECGRALDDARPFNDELLLCGHCNELLYPGEAIRGLRARIRIALRPQHSNTADRLRDIATREGPARGFRGPFRPLWAHIALALYETAENHEPPDCLAALADLQILAEPRPRRRRRYWSRELGWTSLGIATTYDPAQQQEIAGTLPIAGDWCQFAAAA